MSGFTSNYGFNPNFLNQARNREIFEYRPKDLMVPIPANFYPKGPPAPPTEGEPGVIEK